MDSSGCATNYRATFRLRDKNHNRQPQQFITVAAVGLFRDYIHLGGTSGQVRRRLTQRTST